MTNPSSHAGKHAVVIGGASGGGGDSYAFSKEAVRVWGMTPTSRPRPR